MARLDPHSVADSLDPVVAHIDWAATVDFATRTIAATATLTLTAPVTTSTSFSLDTRDLHITDVTAFDGERCRWSVGDADTILGAPLRIRLPPSTRKFVVRYTTSPEASALQWLSPAQTLGGEKPYLFSQCQAIHARSVLPCQDTPARRVTYTASLTVPSSLVAVMAAAPKGREVSGELATFQFEMKQPIPPYLLAFAVGDLVSKDLSARSRVWAEPPMLEAAAWEFENVEAHLQSAEALFGPYDWERFDLLVMPPSFPYGGMENPRLTFVTPTLVAGDRSMVNVIAHELAHSWTGNLVTNTNAEHFWLNEGFTVYAERRILEALEGVEMAKLHEALGRKELDEAIEQFAEAGTPELTRLKTNLDGVDPDAAFSQVPYEKGYFFLRAMEDEIGRPAFDALLKSWLAAHRFGAVDTDDFVAHVEAKNPGLLKKVNAKAWLDEAGLPANCPKPVSTRLEALMKHFGTVPDASVTAKWSATEVQLFLDFMPRGALKPEALKVLDARLGLSTSKNSEVHVAWLLLALESGHEKVLPQVEAFVSRVGRMKYLKPLFRALAAQPRLKPHATALFEKYRKGWHLIAQQTVGRLV